MRGGSAKSKLGFQKVFEMKVGRELRTQSFWDSVFLLATFGA